MTWIDSWETAKVPSEHALSSILWILKENKYANAAASIIVWLFFGTLRHHNDPTFSTDLWLFVAIRLYQAAHNLDSFTRILPWFKSFGFASTLSILTILTVSTIYALSQSPSHATMGSWQPIKCDQPLIHRCLTTHTRMFPTTNTFSYSYLQVSVPVAFRGIYGRMFSVGPTQAWSLFSINPLDHLERHCELTSLDGRLNSFLKAQGVTRAEWSHGYLVTAPKFLGYSFNPVSFWYVYDQADQLTMMVLEVNNTFDERRMYLLKSGMNASEHDNPSAKFRDTWRKDFHVSPFNSRKGAYSLSALNPFRLGQFNAPGINNTIVLSSSKQHSKLVARLYSDDTPLSIDSFTFRNLLVFVLQWSWLGFFTLPRILKEAFLLFFRKRLHIWLRPEVAVTSVSRTATDLERSLESFLHRYLLHKVETYGAAARVCYSSSLRAPSVLSNNGKGLNPLELDIQVLSPAFFSRLAHYKTLQAAFRYEGFSALEKCQTVEVSNPEALWRLLDERPLSDLPVDLSFAQKLQWRVLMNLRRKPSPLPYSKGSNQNVLKEGIGHSSLDQFVASTCADSWWYRRILTRLFLAQHLSFNLVGTIDLLDFSVRALLIATAQWNLSTQYGVHAWAMMKG